MLDNVTYWIVNSLAVVALCVLLAGVLIPQILLIAYRRKLFDEVDERKVHKGHIPRLGGMAFEPVILLSVAGVLGGNSMMGYGDFGAAFQRHGLLMIAAFCSVQLLYLTGIADDLIGIKYRAKFVVQLMCAALLITAGCWFTTLGGALGLGELNAWLGMPFTAIVIVFVINAINLIDGIDGLASGLSSIACAVYGAAFMLMGEYAFAVLAFATMGVLFPFFYYNVFGNAERHSKIFMGDTGSLTIGLMLALLGVKLYTMPATAAVDFQPAVLAFSPLVVPAFDVVRVYIVRIRAGHSPFMPDKNHIHHKLLAAGCSARVAMVSIVTVSTGLTLLNLGLSKCLDINIIIVLDVVLWLVFNHLVNRGIARRKALTD